MHDCTNCTPKLLFYMAKYSFWINGQRLGECSSPFQIQPKKSCRELQHQTLCPSPEDCWYWSCSPSLLTDSSVCSPRWTRRTPCGPSRTSSCPPRIGYKSFISAFQADYLELATLGVQWEGVKQHRADEGDVGGLAEIYKEIFKYFYNRIISKIEI